MDNKFTKLLDSFLDETESFLDNSKETFKKSEGECADEFFKYLEKTLNEDECEQAIDYFLSSDELIFDILLKKQQRRLRKIKIKVSS